MSEREIKEGIRRAIYNFIWQTAHLYKDAPGGKLACPQRSMLERYVNTKITIFDFMLEKANSKSEMKRAVSKFQVPGGRNGLILQVLIILRRNYGNTWPMFFSHGAEDRWTGFDVMPAT